MTNLTTDTSITAPIEWHAIHTRHQHERIVADSLRANGFEVFFPTYTVIRQWTDRRKQISLPLFPCYVFVRSCFERRFRIVTTPGVHSLVMLAGRPAPISDLEIDGIRKAVESKLRVEPHPFLDCGDWVRIHSGPLVGHQGILIRKKGSYRLILSLELLGKSAAVEVDAFSLEPLPHRHLSCKSSTRENVLVGYRAVS